MTAVYVILFVWKGIVEGIEIHKTKKVARERMSALRDKFFEMINEKDLPEIPEGKEFAGWLGTSIADLEGNELFCNKVTLGTTMDIGGNNEDETL